MLYIDGLFHRKMKEFSDFIEEVVDVDDQVDPDAFLIKPNARSNAPDCANDVSGG